MHNRLLFAAGAAALGIALVALPSHSSPKQEQNGASSSQLENKAQQLQEHLQERFQENQDRWNAQQERMARAWDHYQQAMQRFVNVQAPDDQDLSFVFDGEGASWLGVETHEVTSEKARELKLPAERGVVLGKVISDSPASKSGLKENDVVTEINGQRVEGTAQFRRMIREIPPGRTVQLTVWRDGHTENISVTLGKAEESRHIFKMNPSPGTFAFNMPDVMIPKPEIEWDGNNLFLGNRPRLGIDAEDLNGQLGTFFGAPEGEGILVREVNAGSPAEKAGLKAGDVITSVDGDRIRSVGELREKLSAKMDRGDNKDNENNKNKTVSLGILRNHSAQTIPVELPEPAPRIKNKIVTHRTNI